LLIGCVLRLGAVVTDWRYWITYEGTVRTSKVVPMVYTDADMAEAEQLAVLDAESKVPSIEVEPLDNVEVEAIDNAGN
jgi:hypothetical protein